MEKTFTFMEFLIKLQIKTAFNSKWTAYVEVMWKESNKPCFQFKQVSFTFRDGGEDLYVPITLADTKEIPLWEMPKRLNIYDYNNKSFSFNI